MRSMLLGLVPLIALAGCFELKPGPSTQDDTAGMTGSLDSDGDGLTDDEEAELGLDPDKADSDDDGLSDPEELDAGTDPLNADSDGDQFSDSEELDAGTDPLICWSVPEGWPECTVQAAEDGRQATGWSMGDVIDDWKGVDQFGNDINFWAFHGMVVVVDLSAGWCGPCNQAAPSSEAIYQEYKDQGFMMVHLMIDDWSYDGAVSDTGFTADWAQTHGLNFPVVTDDSMSGYAELYYEWYFLDYVSGVPTFAVIDRDGKLVDIWSGGDEHRMRNQIEKAL